jgi:hypothetical protein
VHTVIETQEFIRASQAAGMTRDEVSELVSVLALNPSAGVVIEGTGGCRKLRFAKQGRGKSGGVRVITFYADDDIPVFLLTVFAKSDADNLSAAGKAVMRKVAKEIVKAFGR